MSQFYEIDSTKISLREYWWGTKSPALLIALLLKWLRIRIPNSSDDPNTESLMPFVVDALPPDIAAGFEPLSDELAALGFIDPVYHVIEDAGTRTTIYWATFRRESGNYFARIHQRFWQQAQKKDRGKFVLFFSAFEDGTFLVSSSGKPDQATPETVRMNRMYRAPVPRLWEKHQSLTVEMLAEKSVFPVGSSEELIGLSEYHHILLRDFNLQRGVFRVRNADEQKKADAFASSKAQAGGVENADIMAELKQMQTVKPGWKSTSWILVLSLVAFVAFGAWRWDWKFTLLIIPVLFFHEAGHWVAMRIFRYQNMRMFFIPLFGAAVTGQNWNVPGWKKAVVALAGPLPGIALGIMLGCVGLIFKRPFLNEAAFLLLFVNGLNLLPMLPFDGGRVLQTIIFCRNRWLNVAFQFLAVLGLIGLGLTGFFKFMQYIAIPLAITLPLTYKLGKVADELRKENLPQPAPDENQIPDQTASAIITKVKAALPPGTGGKIIAQHSLNVFETLNAHPPGVLGTVSLLAVHGGAVLLAVVFAMLMVIGRLGGGLGDFALAAMRQPQHEYQCSTIQTTTSAGQAQAPTEHFRTTLIATFDKRIKAVNEFYKLKPLLPERSAATLFGDSLLVAVPAGDNGGREKMFAELQGGTTNLFVAVSNMPVSMSLMFIAPTAVSATNISHVLQNYFDAPNEVPLIPPWSPLATKSDYEKFRRAREDWKKIQIEVSEAIDAPELRSSSKKIAAANRRGAVDEAARLQAERVKLMDSLKDTAREKLLVSASPAKKRLVDLERELSRIAYTNRVERAAVFRQLATELGGVALEGEHPAPGADALCAGSGYVMQHGLMVEINWLSFNDAPAGLDALCGWLCDQHCIGFKYDFNGAYPTESSEDEN